MEGLGPMPMSFAELGWDGRPRTAREGGGDEVAKCSPELHVREGKLVARGSTRFRFSNKGHLRVDWGDRTADGACHMLIHFNLWLYGPETRSGVAPPKAPSLSRHGFVILGS